MMVLENVDVTTRARRVHLDLPLSQVMECVTCSLKEKSASFSHWWWKVRSGVSVRRIRRYWRSDEESERDSVCPEGYW